jgi:hypothetical protein
LEDPGTHGTMILRGALKEKGVKILIGLIWTTAEYMDNRTEVITFWDRTE